MISRRLSKRQMYFGQLSKMNLVCTKYQENIHGGKVVRNSFNNKWSNSQITWSPSKETVSDERWDRRPTNSMGHLGLSPACSLAGCHGIGKRQGFVRSENPRVLGFIRKPILCLSEPMLHQCWKYIWIIPRMSLGQCCAFISMVKLKSDKSVRMYVLEVRSVPECSKGTKSRNTDLGVSECP